MFTVSKLFQFLLVGGYLLFFLFVFFTVYFKLSLYWAQISFSRRIRNYHPEIRNSLGIRKGATLLFSQISTRDNFIKRIIKTYTDTWNLISSFGNREKVEGFYRDYVDINAVRVTGDEVLKSKLNSIFSSMSLLIKTLLLAFLSLLLISIVSILSSSI